MGNRCTSCNKMVMLGDMEFEEQSADLEKDDNLWYLNIDVTANLPCGDCGTPVKTTEFSFNQEVKHDCGDKRNWNEPVELELQGVDYEATERYEGKGRGRKTFRGVRLIATIKCLNCSETFSEEDQDDNQASFWDEA